MDGHAPINQDQREGGSSIIIHVKHYICKVKTDLPENLKNYRQNTLFFSVVYEAKGMNFCRQVPTTCVHKHFVLGFPLFA